MVEKPSSSSSSSKEHDFTAGESTKTTEESSNDDECAPMRRRKRMPSRLPSAVPTIRMKGYPAAPVAIIFFGFGILYSLVHFFSYSDHTGATAQQLLRVASLSTSSQRESLSVVGPCAINLYGLPRKFKDLVSALLRLLYGSTVLLYYTAACTSHMLLILVCVSPPRATVKI
jgi:hypothetical protein